MSKKEEHRTCEDVRGIPPLEPADVILIHHKRKFLRRFLRYVIGSHWDHTAMVLYPRDEKKGVHHTIFVESIKRGAFQRFATRSVAIHQLDLYLNKKYDIGIIRAKHLSDEDRERIVTYMLMNVDAPYWPWKEEKFIIASIFPSYKKRLLAKQRFSCSGLIQKAFFDAMPWDRKKDYIFKPGSWSPIELQELTSPADIAHSPRFEWVYKKRI